MKKYFFACLIWLIFFAPILLGSQKKILVLTVYSLLLAIFVLSRKKIYSPLLPASILTALILWLVINSLFFSGYPYSSMRSAFIFIAAALLFFAGVNISQKNIRSIIIFGSLTLVFVGFIFFLWSRNYTYLRMASVFYYHNAFAGFLIVPIILAVGWAIEKKEKMRLYSYGAVFFLVMGFVLTFSRGGFISLGLSLSFFFILLWRNQRREAIGKIAIIFLLFALGASAAFGIMQAKKIQAKKIDTAVSSPYSGESVGETSSIARIEYAKRAWELFREKPLQGHGWNTYGKEVKRIRQNPLFFSADPHNLYLKFLSETGLFGGLLFFVFVSYVLLLGFRKILVEKNNVLHLAIYSGFLGVLLHNGVDADFIFLGNLVLFFALAAILVKNRKKETEEPLAAGDGRGQKTSVRLINFRLPLFFFLMFLLIIFGAFFISDKYFDRAVKYLNENSIGQFRGEFAKAVSFDKFNPNLKIKGAEIFMAKGENKTAKLLLDEAESFAPRESRIWTLRGALFIREGKNREAEAAYRQSLLLAPLNFDPVIGLIDIFLKEKRIGEAKLLLEETNKKFPPSVFDSSYWISPEKRNIKEGLSYFNELMDQYK